MNRKRVISLLTALGLCFSLAGCGSSAADVHEAAAASGNSADAAVIEQDKEEIGVSSTADSTVAVETEQMISSSSAAVMDEEDMDKKIREIIAGMTTEQKIAQMIIISLRSDPKNTRTPTELTEDYVKLLQRYDFGGVILMEGNIVDPAQTVRLNRACQEAALASEPGIPMFITLDEEGGMVNRIGYGTTGPGNMSLAAAGGPEMAEECADILGQESAALGFNVDFAPVADVNSNPNNPIIGVRSFSDDPEVAAEYVQAFLKGLKKNGVISSLKHFPGHGNVGEDSHTHLPCSDYTIEDLESCDLIPFKAGIEAGAEMIMTAHIQYPSIIKETYISVKDGKEISLPSTLSRTIIHDLLREKMGYDGIVITDAMVMDAIALHFDPIDAAVLAINAGVDILLIPVDVYKDEEINSFPVMEAYIQDLTARVEAGDIPQEELDDSVYRILKLKMESGNWTNALEQSEEEMIANAEAIVGSAANHAREWELAQMGMTLLKNENSALPLDGNDGKKTLILYPVERRRPSIDYALSRVEKEGLADSKAVTSLCYAGVNAEDEVLQNALSEADRILILSTSANKNETLTQVITQIHEKGGQAALISLNIPYDSACYQEADAIFCAYNPYGSAHYEEGNGPFNLNVAAAICTAFGLSVPAGHLPVNIPTLAENDEGKETFTDTWLYERGWGLMNWGEN